MSVRYFVRWPNGALLPVRLGADATGADLFSLLSFSLNDREAYMIMTFHKEYLKCDDALINYIPPESVIDIVTGPRDYDNESLSSEYMRLLDLQFSAFEGDRNGQLIFESLIESDSVVEEGIVEKTNIDYEPRITSTALPRFWGKGDKRVCITKGTQTKKVSTTAEQWCW